MSDQPVIVWFRNDLRIEDNPALFAARESGRPVIPLYILDEQSARAPGAASRWWLHHSLRSLSEDLQAAGTRLVLRRGDSKTTLLDVVAETNAAGAFWNRRYYAPHIETDKAVKSVLTAKTVEARSFNGSLLREPWEVETNSGGPYRVYTPFWKSLRSMGPARETPLPRIRKIEGPSSPPESDALDDWALTPSNPDWAEAFPSEWRPGEQGARD
ncbi:MAG: deoxyribodipyrimidine photo-lyase, partial [Hyphococcus sp.]